MQQHLAAQAARDSQLDRLESSLAKLSDRVVQLDSWAQQGPADRRPAATAAQDAQALALPWWQLAGALLAGSIASAWLMIGGRGRRPQPRIAPAVAAKPWPEPPEPSFKRQFLAPVAPPPAPEQAADPALELVDLMVSMGLAKSAAQTLVGHIRENPRQSLHHWLRLLDLHRLAGSREDFDRSADELRQHFNLMVPAWQEDSMGEPRSSIEDFPHLRSQLLRLWRTPDCARELYFLLTDSRDGTRSGFSQAVAEELLLLIAILEDV